MFRSSNPVLNDKIVSRAGGLSAANPMTIQGTVNKCYILLFLTFLSAAWIWRKLMSVMEMGMFAETAVNPAAAMSQFQGYIFGGAIIGFILVMVTIFKLNWSPVTAPIYALCEGLVLGGISAVAEIQYPGIAVQAVMLTLAVLFCMLGAYTSGMIKVTQKFRIGVMAAGGALLLVYIVNFVMGFFGGSIPFLHSSTPLGIGISLLICGLAAMFLLLDFDLIDRFADQGAPKFMEWYGAMSLLITLVWLYIEVLQLLMSLRGRE